MGFLLNRAKANTTATGTGAVTPSTPVSPYQAWSAAGAVSGRYYDYLIEEGTAWECGTGLYNGTTITRPGPGTDPSFQSSTGSLLSLSGTATIACVGIASDLNVVSNPAYKLGFCRPVADFTQIAISGAYSVTDYAGKAVVIKDAIPGTGFQLAGIRRTAPATPYRVVMCVQPAVFPVNYLGWAWGFTDNTKFSIVSQYDGARIGSSDWSNATTRSAFALLGDVGPLYGTIFVSAEDDGTTARIGISSNGVDFRAVRTITKSGSFLGASGFVSVALLLTNLGSGGASGAAAAQSIALREYDEAGLTRGF